MTGIIDQMNEMKNRIDELQKRLEEVFKYHILISLINSKK